MHFDGMVSSVWSKPHGNDPALFRCLAWLMAHQVVIVIKQADLCLCSLQLLLQAGSLHPGWHIFMLALLLVCEQGDVGS